MTKYTPFEDFRDGFAAHGFNCLRAAMMKNRKTGSPMPLYLCDSAPQTDFDKIYSIKNIGLMSVTIERQRAKNKVKLCYRCSGFNHSSIDCRPTPKCMVCSGPILRLDCPFKGKKITPTCPNCSGPHVSTFSGCPGHTSNAKKLKTETDNPAIGARRISTDEEPAFTFNLKSIPLFTNADKIYPECFIACI